MIPRPLALLPLLALLPTADGAPAGGRIVNVAPAIVGFALYESPPTGGAADACPPGPAIEAEDARWTCVVFEDANGWQDVCRAVVGADCAGAIGRGRIVRPVGPSLTLDAVDRSGTGERLTLG